MLRQYVSTLYSKHRCRPYPLYEVPLLWLGRDDGSNGGSRDDDDDDDESKNDG